ncbi:MAG TPA: tripartite tricarboxylate transporter substrate binding protein [Ramlibacter sp.]|uniref:Bug family tripartite tricarboxylate transporter substrate binding protein n=1 Tax=Ramlibacter sp. TaxID=1917967 RepID=UPI002C86EC6E|nr:tripartite tricarboxylate transporter substrate binding protein [Ramlibacter sp.]HVZ44888.1 tripartite tricarboxylate transporter substrate binding protein [Ramlibacter sp.]
MLRRLLLSATFGFFAFAHGWAGAQTYPARPVHVIVGFAAGGPTDILARLTGERLSRLWGQPVVVENRPGAGGLIALDVVRRAPADGLVFGVLNLNQIVAEELLPKPTFDIQKELVAVSGLAQQGNVLVVNPAIPAKTPSELIAYLKAHPAMANYASGGNGSPAHLAGELFKTQAGVQMTHVAYKGAAPALQDVVSGQVNLMFAAAPPALPLVKAGKLRALAVTSAKRMAQFPDLPTLAESGISVDVLDWQGFVVPRGTPAAVVSKINADLLKVMAAPDFRERVGSLGGETAGGTPSEFAAHIAAETRKWRKVIKESGITAN